MKKFLLSLLIGWSCCPSFAQESWLFTQPSNNPILNPAFAGSMGSMRINLGYGAEYLGVAGGPRITQASFDACLGQRDFKHGVFLSASSTVLGEGRCVRTDLSPGYSFIFPVFKRKFEMAAGVSGSLIQCAQYDLATGRPLGWWGGTTYSGRIFFTGSEGVALYSSKTWISIGANYLPHIYKDSPTNKVLYGPRINFSAGYKLALSKSSGKVFLVPMLSAWKMKSTQMIQPKVEGWFGRWMGGLGYSYTKEYSLTASSNNVLLNNHRACILGGFRSRKGLEFRGAYYYATNNHNNDLRGGAVEFNFSCYLKLNKREFVSPWQMQGGVK